jgi:hypothetical protein
LALRVKPKIKFGQQEIVGFETHDRVVSRGIRDDSPVQDRGMNRGWVYSTEDFVRRIVVFFNPIDLGFARSCRYLTLKSMLDEGSGGDDIWAVGCGDKDRHVENLS